MDSQDQYYEPDFPLNEADNNSVTRHIIQFRVCPLFLPFCCPTLASVIKSLRKLLRICQSFEAKIETWIIIILNSRLRHTTSKGDRDAPLSIVHCNCMH